MPMIALAALVVVSDDAVTGDHIGEPVLEGMPGWRNGLADTPNHNFDESIAGDHNTTPNQGNGLHVGDHAYTRVCCQLLQHIHSRKCVATYATDCGSQMGMQCGKATSTRPPGS